ncbi:heavy metal translocating P-type ATPase [Catenovulum sp. 2E275]|uniref:heavy metal translocating P-type ATPase n=1 Tax=Catenovulum sp. 2E275 TaxID=2980497 RepID=UPI0021D2F28F|nr:heavy metal translocating P-type ATPase [Catenovulum sp. 2E275]MCU4674529.1 heavy metal translocating P-type ATPase [Catenovulum sp. 2E275]
MSQLCFHCGEKIPANCDLSVEVSGKPQAVCCIGCQAVANAILAEGLSQYYKFREQPADKANLSDELVSHEYLAYDEASVQAEFVRYHGDKAQADLSIEGMHCAACAWLIEKRLKQLAGISQVTVNLTQSRAQISWNSPTVKLSQIFQAIEQVGYKASAFKLSEIESYYSKRNKEFMRQLVVAGFFTMQVMMLAFAMYSDVLEAQYDEFFRWISLLLTTPVVLYSSQPIIRSSLIAVKNKMLNMDVPVAIAILGTYFASCYATFSQTGEVYFESAAMFVFLLLTSRYLEHQVKSKATSLSANMLKLLPLVAYKKMPNGQFEAVSANSLIKGDIILVKQGQTIPADGILLSESVMVEEAMLTGESLPLSKLQNDLCLAGCIVIDQSIEIQVTSSGKATTLAQIAYQQEQISENRSGFINAADKVAKQATLGVLVLAALTFFGWQLLMGENGLWYAVAVLVATCPCALSLALPTALSASSSALKTKGILIQNTNAIEQAYQLKAIAFDKTGTLTTGQFSLSKIQLTEDFSQTQILNWVSQLEFRANHPLASAFQKPDIPAKMSAFRVLPGMGLSAEIDNKKIMIGSYKLVEQMASETLAQHFLGAQIYIFVDQQFAGAIWLQDKLRADALTSVNQISAYQCILSGDTSEQLKQVAQALNLPYQGGVSAEQKTQALIQLRQEYGLVAMVGDGINDALVLAEADVSIAMNEASSLSKQKADVVLLGSQLDRIVLLIKQSQRLNKIIKQNFSWAIAYNLLVLPLAVVGILTPWMAVIGMSASSLIVVINSMRLLKI